jgi:hypothetical protein
VAAPAGEQHPGIVGTDGLDSALAALEHLDVLNLQIRWRELFGRSAPVRLGADLLRRAIAYRLQELALGGLSRPAQLRLKAAGNRAGKGVSDRGGRSSPAIVKPGTRFVREWQNEVHEVQAIETGHFVYRGKTFRSLSLIARTITGTAQSGPRFFGMRRTGSGPTGREASDG